MAPGSVSRVVGLYLLFLGLRSFLPGDTAVPTILLILTLQLLASENKRWPIRLVTGPVEQVMVVRSWSDVGLPPDLKLSVPMAFHVERA